jgi:Ca-activated chloride channel homolog
MTSKLLIFLIGLTLIPVGHGQDHGPRPEPAAGGSLRAPDSRLKVNVLGSGPSAPDGSPDSWTFQKLVDEVTVSFSVTDGRRFVQDVTQENIRVLDDHKPVVRILAFRHQRDLPLRLGLLVDTSASVNPRFRFEQQAATQFLRKIVRHGLDRAFVLGFADHALITQDYSDDPGQLAAGVAALHNGGGTALFDAIHAACEKLRAAQGDEPAAQILVVLSDGDDNTSRKTLNQAINTAQIRDITIYTINTRGETVDFSNGGLTAKGDAAMREIAEQTGGRSFRRMSNWELTRAFSAIDEETRNRYSLSYQPRDLEENGRFRRIQIAAEKPGRRLRIHARKGYYAKLQSIR